MISEFVLWAWERAKTITGFGLASKSNLFSLINKILLGKVIVWMRFFKTRDSFSDEKSRLSDPQNGILFSLGFVKAKTDEYLANSISKSVYEFKMWFEEANNQIQTNLKGSNNMV